MTHLVVPRKTDLQSKPSFEGTEDTSPGWADGDWGRPALSDHPEAEEGDDFEDLSESDQNSVRERFVLQSGDSYSDLGYPVVNPSTGNLNRNGVAAAKQRASAEDDSGVLSIVNDLWDEHFADEEEQGLATAPLIITKSRNENGKAEPSREELRAKAPDRAFFSADIEELEVGGSDLQTINENHSEIELSEEDLVLFRDWVAHDEVPDVGMRRPLAFTEDALNKLAQDFRKGRTFNLHHQTRRQVGSTFDAEVSRNSVGGIEANWLSVKWYAVTKNATRQRKQDITDMSTGVLPYTSMEVRGGKWEMKEMDVEDEEMSYFEISDNPEEPGTERLEAEGIARVHLGAVRGAGSK